uniref:Perlucin 4 n=1 Tax=Haliotis diversicolor TaxID=36095 RepID=G5CT95_HALDV|nr:perlucin 4 [Haliotis diversicolor]
MLIILLCLTISVTLCTSCDKGFFQYGDSCYIILPETGTWLTAMEYCKAFGMSLTIVQSADENKFLKDYLYTHRGTYTSAPDFWTAGTHLMSTEWAWAGTDEEIEMFFWGPGEPNNVGSTERCLSFYANANFTWDDEHCTYPGYPLCEKQLQVYPGK